MVCRLVLAWIVVVHGLAHAAYAETIALLPLDTSGGDKKLEIYSQPVASEIARALKAAGLEVVVVKANMTVPERAQLIVDGTISAGKGDSATLTLRIRDPRDGTTMETLPPATATLKDLDKAASELSARVVPSVRTNLAIVLKPKQNPIVDPNNTNNTKVQPPVAPPAPLLPGVLVGVSEPMGSTASTSMLRAAIEAELAPWAKRHEHTAVPIEPAKLAKAKEATKAVAMASTEVGLAIHVLGLRVTKGSVPMAKARVRVRIIDREAVKFDRVIVTDTIVGGKNLSPLALARIAAREVLLILHPNVRRNIPEWKK